MVCSTKETHTNTKLLERISRRNEQHIQTEIGTEFTNTLHDYSTDEEHI